MKKFYLLYFLLLSFLSSAQTKTPADHNFSFPDSTYIVDQIVVTGNELTKQYIIEQEMTVKVGSLLTYEALQYSIDRIYSLQLFTKVESNIVVLHDSLAVLVIAVKERWYFYPYPIAGIKDRSWDKLYYGLGLIHQNFAGENVRLYAQFAIGYDPFFSFGYVNPLMNRDHQLFFAIRGSYSEQRNRSLASQALNAQNFDEQRSAGEISLGKRYSLYTTFSSTLNFLRLRVSDNVAGRTLSSSGVDNFFSLSTSYVYDTRDLKEYPRLGTYIGASISKIGLFDKVVDYQRIGLDVRRYIPIYFDAVFAARVFGNLASGGRIPNYDHVFFGYGERIRGHFNTIIEGEQIAGATAELHYPLIKPHYMRFDWIPFEQFRDIRYALYVAAFGDAGNTWFRNEPIALNRWYSGYGVGLHFHLAYSAVFRLEYGIPSDNLSKGEFIFDVGAAL